MESQKNHLCLPSTREIEQAVNIYVMRAYRGEVSPAARGLMPPADFDPAAWLMGAGIERDPADAPLEQVRSFAIRLGNEQYPHMKLRLSRPPGADLFVFSVDAHDAFLHAPPGSPDYDALEQLQRYNMALSDSILSAWDAAGLPTERNYLRRKIEQAKQQKSGK